MSATFDFLMANWLTLISWIVRVGALIVIPFRRSASEARTWLLLFFVVPIPALLVYLAIGRPAHSKKRKALFDQLPAVLGRAVERAGLGTVDVKANLPTAYQSISALSKSLGSMPALAGNAVELLPDYEDVIAGLVADVDAAIHHVHLEFYIFADDATGHKLCGALERAEARGVECRVLIDAMGSFGFGHKTERKLAAAGVEVHRILPLARRWTSSRIDLRNHRKIAVIDGRIAYTGSQNIVDARIKRDFANVELMCRVKGPVVGALQAVFLGDWFLETQTELDEPHLFDLAPRSDDQIAQAVPSGPDYAGRGIDLLFVDLVHRARSEVVLVTPYFIPNQALLAALKSASLRGVDVKLVLSRRLDSLLVDLAQRSYYAELLHSGVRIFLFEANFLHAKHLRIDCDIALIGSSNMDMRSFELNAEISLICYGSEIAGQLVAIENTYLQTSMKLDESNWSERSLGKKVFENIARLLSDLL